jgi:hypothetical protein
MIDRTPYVSIAAKVATIAGNAASSNGGADWLGVVGEMTGALLVGGSGDSTDAGDGAAAFNDSTPLGDAQPFDYVPDPLSNDTEDIAASTNNPRFAAKMLGYDKNTFSDMLHEFKPANGLRPADNVIFHDDGIVEFNGQMLDDNIHSYAP